MVILRERIRLAVLCCAVYTCTSTYRYLATPFSYDYHYYYITIIPIRLYFYDLTTLRRACSVHSHSACGKRQIRIAPSSLTLINRRLFGQIRSF